MIKERARWLVASAVVAVAVGGAVGTMSGGSAVGSDTPVQQQGDFIPKPSGPTPTPEPAPKAGTPAQMGCVPIAPKPLYDAKGEMTGHEVVRNGDGTMKKYCYEEPPPPPNLEEGNEVTLPPGVK